MNLPSEKILQQKQEAVAALTEKLKNAAAGVLVDYKGINVADDTKLRKELREAGVEYAVVKNTLLRFAAKEVGYDALDSVLEGTTALALSDGDQVVAAKILTKYAEDSKGKFVVKAGFVDGGVIDAAKVAELGKDIAGLAALLAAAAAVLRMLRFFILFSFLKKSSRYCSHNVRPATHLAILNRLWRWGEMHSSQNTHPPCQSAE